MAAFTKLERAALISIFSETPSLERDLRQQLRVASVEWRENTGRGFFTRIIVPTDAPALAAPRELGRETHARVAGLDSSWTFSLYLKDGRLDWLEAYAVDDTTGVNLARSTFEVFRIHVSGQLPLRDEASPISNDRET